MQLTWSRMPLKLAGVFKTAMATRTDKETLWVKITHQDATGWGEAAPVDTYRQTLESNESALSEIAALLPKDPYNIEETMHILLTRFDHQRAAVAAVDAAWHDWMGKKHAIPVVKLLGLNPGVMPVTSFTIGIDEPAAVIEKVRRAEQYPVLKIKIGLDLDEKILATIREIAPNKRIRVDANTAWTVDQAMAKLPILAGYNVEFVEQPIEPGDNAGLRRLTESRICPIVADESCVRLNDVAPLAGCVDGINIKLSKCGGIREGLKMIRVAKALGMKVMLGCMVESSLGIAAAAQLAPLADWLDLDGHLLLAQDPFTGLGGANGILTVGGSPGLGVNPVQA